MSVIRCKDCDEDITHKIKVYYKKVVRCEDCNIKYE